MINLEKMAEKYRGEGYSGRNADARVCQDIVLKAIARSNLGRNVTIKGDKIEQLSQQEYSGKRVYITINDEEGKLAD